MTYPVISKRVAQQIADDIKAAVEAGGDPLEVAADETQAGVKLKEGADYDLTAVKRCSELARKELLPGVADSELATATKPKSDERTALEVNMVSRVHQCLSVQDIGCLQSPDFWRYLALFPFRWYLLAREPDLKPQAFGGVYKASEDGDEADVGDRTIAKTQLMLRTYLWGKGAFDGSELIRGTGDGYTRAGSITAASPIDVWHSHIVRIQMGQLGQVPHAFIDAVNGFEFNTDEARELEKLTTRMKHNILLDVYDLDQALELFEEQRPDAEKRAEAKAAKKKADAAATEEAQ